MSSEMTYTNLLEPMRRAWSFTGRQPAARESMQRFAAAYPELHLEAVIDLRDLVDTLSGGTSRPREDRWKIVNKMLEAAGDPQIAAALVQTLLPGIVHECERMRWGKGIPGATDEMLARAVVSATEIVHRWAGEERDYALGDILNATRSRVRDWMLKEKQIAHALDVDAAELARFRPAPPTDRIAARLESYRGTDKERVAALTAARVYDQATLRELRAASGLTNRQLYEEMQSFASDHLLD